MNIDNLWEQVSKEDLWKEIAQRWETTSQARMLMTLAMHHDHDMPLPEIAAQTGLSPAWLTDNLSELEQQGIVSRREDDPPRYGIASEDAFLEFLTEFFHRIEVAAGYLSLLAHWASGDEQN